MPVPQLPEYLREMAADAASVQSSAIDREMGEMCKHSLFELARNGTPISQHQVDAAERAFVAMTERLMPARAVAQFVAHACENRVMPQIDRADLVPGFTADEAIAGGAAALRAASPLKKFTRNEVLGCLAWNRAVPANPVAIAQLVALVQAYAHGVRELVRRRSRDAADKLARFSDQWSPKNVLKFVNAALYVAGRAAGREPIAIDQPLVNAAMDLLNHSGAFTWQSEAPAVRIHCPAQAFLHKLIVNEGALMPVIDFVTSEAARDPIDADLARSLALIGSAAEEEAAGIAAHGQGWSLRKMGAHGL